MHAYRHSLRAAGLWLSAIVLICGTGCPVVSNLPSPGRVVQETDPEFGRTYHLYVPQRQPPLTGWPLVVTCHGTPPWDTATRQLDEWKGLAEQKGFLLVAPELVGTHGDFPPAPPEQIRRQLADEEAILSIVRAVMAAYRVDDSRVFLTGWSAGSYAVLFTGLRNPGVFRAMSIRQGNFNPEYVEPCVPFLDRHQPIHLTYGSLDLLKSDSEACIDWLRAHEMEPLAQERPGAHKRDPGPVFAFFADVVRRRPWIRVRVLEDPQDPMKVSFSVKSSFEPVRYLWDFGDGSDREPVAAPEHKFEKPGLYSVRVGLWRDEDDRYIRQIPLQVPRIRLGAAPPATAPAE